MSVTPIPSYCLIPAALAIETAGSSHCAGFAFADVIADVIAVAGTKWRSGNGYLRDRDRTGMVHFKGNIWKQS